MCSKTVKLQLLQGHDRSVHIIMNDDEIKRISLEGKKNKLIHYMHALQKMLISYKNNTN